MRKSVWELLNNRKIDADEIYSLINDIIAHVSNFYFNKYYDKISNSYGFATYEDLINGITNKTTDTTESFLMISELYLTSTKYFIKDNVPFYGIDIKSEIDILEKRIYYYLNNMNYSISFNDEKEKGIVHKNDEVAESVAHGFITELLDKENAWRIISFHSASTSIQEKEDAIRALYLKLESIRQEYSTNQLFKDTKRLMNYFRHTKEPKKSVAEIENNKEVFLDLAYDMFLQVFLNHFNKLEINKHQDIINKIN